jgi:surfeit locus 1 family protein
MDEARRRFPVGLTLAVAVALAILLGLGAWQLQRLRWKEDLIAHVAALRDAPAQPAGAALDRLARGGDVDFTRVRLDCPGLATAPYLQLYGLKDGQAGWRLISACPAASVRYRTLLVDRGFVPDTVAARPRVHAGAPAALTVTGVLRMPEPASFVAPANQPAANHWFTRDVAAMARALGAPSPAPAMLFAETSANPEFPDLVPAPLPAQIPNRHMEYALTWFGLAAALAGVYAAMLFKRRKV